MLFDDEYLLIKKLLFMKFLPEFILLFLYLKTLTVTQTAQRQMTVWQWSGQHVERSGHVLI
jgi:hypothetical protein